MGRESDSSSKSGEPTVAELVNRYQRMVEVGRAFVPMAAANLEYWLSKKGGVRHIPATHFQNNSAVVSHLEAVHRAIFLSKKDPAKGIVPRIRMNPRPMQHNMTWEDSTYANAFTDLFFGLGGFTVKSTVVVDVKPAAGNPKAWDVTFKSWQAQVFDDYNWDHNKSVSIPGWGEIQDSDAIRVEKADLARSFKIESAPWQVTQSSVIGPAQVKL